MGDRTILFSGDRIKCADFCRSRDGYYVYVLFRPDGRPFYVGKGNGDRLIHHENEARHPNGRRSNSHKLNIIRSIWRSKSSVTYEIDSWHDNETTAYRRETELISELKRLHEGGPLTNREPGGGSTAGRSPFSRQRHSATLGGIPDDNPERAVLNRFVLSVGGMASVVVKPASQFMAKPTLRYPTKSISLKRRTAVAVVAAAAAQGTLIADGAMIARRMVVDEVEGLLENGVCCDLLTAGIVDILPASQSADERLRIRSGMARKIIGLVGFQRCADLGVVETDLVRENGTS